MRSKKRWPRTRRFFWRLSTTPPIDEPKANDIFQVGTIVNIVQSLKLPDGNIKVLVEGIERGKILQVTDTEGFMQATVRVARFATEANQALEASMQRVTSLFEQYVKLCQALNYETMISAVRMEDPAKLTDVILWRTFSSPSKKNKNCLRFSIRPSA